MRSYAFLSLGTNIEPRYQYLEKAMEILESHKDITIIKKSSIYETEPVGYLDQADFLNIVIEIETSLSSISLLDFCQRIEYQLGRERNIRFGPRTIDLDILIYNQENSSVERLILPHPRMHERAFVVIPLYEISPDIMVPKWNKTVSELRSELLESDIKGVRRWMPNGQEEG
ncbi:2-amino-4-hydroxy-6-hydroxymethyldihydropteridine diphosphokinase [Oceanobacillus piezotolerans]|uniref:2-amino-4-hydroxy-6-hydroxymethyldihydropteridine diphosphokinase n=1 Tax=Oceanobacillus piezotolerans TaxID=2448030 RepID=A0A498D4D1_9BACI|nr:2-amino-4-hydroxy-6-hydroxymethyldihydropteridine diphosphokinase [Oceanobacillus piezotolerans]RLL41661.1 2-amino-4-hydroxy-6-hydroxymethyldihydropteridine diphosphokinase [Oceanobacillus piezotolerans]